MPDTGSRGSLLWKLYSGYALLVLITAFVSGVLVTSRVEEDLRAEVERGLQVSAELLAEVSEGRLEGPADDAFERRVRDLGSRIGVRLTVVRADGIVVADSEEDPSRMGDHGARPEILEARDRGSSFVTRRSDTVGTVMTYAALSIRRDGRVVGFARAALPLTYVEERLASHRRIVLVAGLVAALAGLVLGYPVVRRITAPLRSMTIAAEAIAEGQPGRAVRATSHDEIGRLARAFNRMSEALRDRVETIERDRSKLEAILASMVEGVVAIDLAEKVVHLNDVAARILTTSPLDALGRRIWEVTRVREVCEALEATLAGGGEARGEFRLPGEPRDRVVSIHSAPLRGASGATAGGVVVLHDITELRRLEGIRRDFVANVSHELKTPLTAIRGAVETMVEDDEMDPAIRARFLGKVRDQCSRLTSLVSDLLVLSRVELLEGELEKEPVDVRGPVREAAGGWQPAAVEKNLSLSIEVPPEPLLVEGDRESLRQAVDNLASNAIRYTPPGGRVWIRARHEGGEIVLEAEDTGIGIEPRHQERVFERFYRVDKARSRELGGTGLGLAIVKHIALAHGGRVSLSSVPGRGSVFRVHLPPGTDRAE